ncbi:MAG: Maf family protein [bacterium]
MKDFPEIILASRSPRRADLLRQMNIKFTVKTKEVNENSDKVDDPEAFVKEISLRKAEAVADEISSGLIIAADTIVYLKGEILGKPKTKEEAKKMLSKLSGNTHEVYTGFTLLSHEKGIFQDVEKTRVTFRILEDWEIDAYVATGSPMDKAGAYGIQDQSGFFVERIEGCFFNVVGFPITKFYQGLRQLVDHELIKKHLF